MFQPTFKNDFPLETPFLLDPKIPYQTSHKAEIGTFYSVISAHFWPKKVAQNTKSAISTVPDNNDNIQIWTKKDPI